MPACVCVSIRSFILYFFTNTKLTVHMMINHSFWYKIQVFPLIEIVLSSLFVPIPSRIQCSNHWFACINVCLMTVYCADDNIWLNVSFSSKSPWFQCLQLITKGFPASNKQNEINHKVHIRKECSYIWSIE